MKVGVKAPFGMNETSGQIIPMNALVPEALDLTLSVLGEGPKKAVLFTLEQKYNLPLHGPLLSIDRVSTQYWICLARMEAGCFLKKCGSI